MKKAIKALVAFGMFVLMSGAATFMSAIVDRFITTKEWQPMSFENCIAVIQGGGRPFQMWVILELIALALSIYIFLTNGSDYYKAKQYKVTDRISIPVPAGQGQYGTAWFMSPDELHKRYTKLKISKHDKVINTLLAKGKERQESVKKYKKSSSKDGVVVDEDLRQRKPEKKKTKRPNAKVKEKKTNAVLRDKTFSLSGLFIFRFSRKVKERLKRRAAEKELAEKTAGKSEQEKSYFPAAGIVLDEDEHNTIYCLTSDTHTLINGSTSSGKTRRLVLPTLCMLALAGESIIATDTKGELNAYSAEFLRSLGYHVTILNFTDTGLSDKYNLLQPVIDAVNEDDISKAISRAWDLTSFLVEKNERTEPIWRNGEMSIIAAAILCVVYDNKYSPEYQNMTNVYYFISEMFRTIKAGKTSFRPIDLYLKERDANHPARGLLGISAVAPPETAGSFYTSALTTLQLFTSPEIYGITNGSDLDPKLIGREKHALFFVLPENKSTYYPIVTLICSQLYDSLTETAKESGNRLSVRVNFLLDEFGNFSKIKDFENMLTVGRGYGIRFNMFIQSFAQLKEKYGNNALTTIQDNCLWIYLSGSAEETNKAWETRLDKYTTTSYSLGGSIQHRSSYSSSSNVSLTGRELLKANEIAQIKAPYVLFSENQQRPAVTKLYDISKTILNKMLGMGNEQHNALLIEMGKTKENIPAPEIKLWEIWKEYNFVF